MRLVMVAILFPLALAGCVTFSSSNPPPPERDSTVAAPSGSLAAR